VFENGHDVVTRQADEVQLGLEVARFVAFEIGEHMDDALVEFRLRRRRIIAAMSTALSRARRGLAARMLLVPGSRLVRID
jgi:hypothetical protein